MVIKKCLVCMRDYKAYNKPKTGHGGRNRVRSNRPSKSITCSKNCSKILIRISVYIKSKIRVPIEEAKNEVR